MILDKLTLNTDINDNVFSELEISRELPETSKTFLDSMPFSLKDWQTEHIMSDEEGDEQIYQNPVGIYLDRTSEVVDQIKVIANSDSSEEHINLVEAAKQTKAEIALFKAHTDRLSGVADENEIPEGVDINKFPTLNIALSVGQQVLCLVYNTSAIPAIKYGDVVYIGHIGQSYESIIAENDLNRFSLKPGFLGHDELTDHLQDGVITTGYIDKENNFLTKKDADNTAMMGSFTSLYTEKFILSYLSKLSRDYNELSTGFKTKPNEIVDSWSEQTITDLQDFTHYMRNRRTSDENFFRNSVKLLKKFHNVRRVNNMGYTHQLLMNKIGTDSGKKLLSGA